MQLITPADAAGRVTDALKGAAQATGASFDYLVRTAKRESALNPAAQNSASSARGLFQFIDSTWLQVLKEEGGKLGLADAAASVSKTSSGRYTVQDPARRAEVLALRNDPQAAALLAGAFTRRNAESLTNSLGRAPNEGELYAAHFMGASGAAQLVTLATNSPDANAASAFPSQASANRAIFFDKGRPRSASEVYAKLTAGGDAAVSVPSFAAAAPADARATARVARVEEVEPLYNNGVENDQTAFHSLFKTGRRTPVASYVAQAWSSFGEAGLAADASKFAIRPSAVADVVAPAYAPHAPVVNRAAAPKAQAALDAVTHAATSKSRRAAVPVATPVSLSRTATATEPTVSQPHAAVASETRTGGLISFLKVLFSPPATAAATPARASARP